MGTTRLANPIASGLRGIDAAAGENQIHRPTVPDQARQSYRPAVDERYAPAPAVDAEDGVLLDDSEVTPQGQLQPTGDRETADGGDHGLGQHHARRPHRTGAGSVDRVGLRCAEGLEICSGAEGSVVTPQHRDGGVVVGVELFEGREQTGCGRSVDGVACRGRFMMTVVTGPLRSARIPPVYSVIVPP